ncbi:hypothetical protein WKT22_02505 [Candidatus Lokiarchaeum ossiferum]
MKLNQLDKKFKKAERKLFASSFQLGGKKILFQLSPDPSPVKIVKDCSNTLIWGSELEI